MSGRNLLFPRLAALSRLYWLSWLFIGCSALAAEGVVFSRDTQLVASPRSDARVIAEIKQGARGEEIARQGAWVNVRTARGTGWTHSFNLGSATAGARSTGPAASAPTRRGALTPTIGIRGLDVEDLRQARYDESQMRLLESYAASPADGEAAAAATGLTAVRIEYPK